MTGFTQLVGLTQLKEHLQGALVSQTISHAYILSGEKGSGKKEIANLFARTLQCERSEAEPCNECHSCRQALSDNHPDIRTLIPEKPDVITVDEIRSRIVNDAEIKPYTGPYKIYIVPDAEKMNIQAQNALLKTLEEPPSYVVILLLTGNLSALLDTIQSRCVILKIPPLRDEQVKAYLMKEFHLPDYQADICVAFARGNIGAARRLAGSDEFAKIRELATALLKNIGKMDTAELAEESRKITATDFDVYGFLDYLQMWFRDVLLYKAARSTEHLLFREDERQIRKRATESSYEGIREILDKIRETKDRLDANVNKEMTIELLLLTIKEN